VPTEHEAKVLDINPDDVKNRILAAGGRQAAQARLMRRYVYDIIPGDMSRWIRLRDSGTETTLCVKEIRSDAIDGTLEVETAVGDFAAANDLLGMLGFRPKSYQENRRTSFVLGDVQLEMDEWPMIPPYLEIEGRTKDDVVRVAGLLGYPEGQLTGENTIKVYARHGIDLTAISDLRFPDDSR
jgi:adenylate cyclase, class 2